MFSDKERCLWLKKYGTYVALWEKGICFNIASVCSNWKLENELCQMFICYSWKKKVTYFIRKAFRIAFLFKRSTGELNPASFAHCTDKTVINQFYIDFSNN